MRTKFFHVYFFITISLIINLYPSSTRGKDLFIITESSPSPMEALAYQELIDAITAMTGKTPQNLIETNSKHSNAIYLGDTAFSRELGIRQNELEEEEWIIREAGKNLVIIGGKPIGTLYGAYRFLNKQGCYFLTEDATVYPHRDISFHKTSERKKPSIPGRCIYDRYVTRIILGKMTFTSQNRFYLRNYINSEQSPAQKYPYCGKWFRLGGPGFYHTYYKYLSPKLFKEHPEYFNMNSQGKRFLIQPQGSQPCMSNPEVSRIMTESLKKFIQEDRKKYPRDQWPVIYDISRTDGTTFICKCPSCDKIVKEESSDIGLELTCINKIAENISKIYPEIIVRTFAYASGELLPKHIRPRPNVNIQYCDLYTKSDPYRPLTHPVNKTQLNKFLDWSSTGCALTVWDYWNMGKKAYNYPPRPEVVIDAVIQDIRFFHMHKIKALFAEAEKSFITPQPFMDLNFFVGSQLMLDSEQDAEKLIDLYIKNYYGPGWKLIRKYFDYLRNGVKDYPKAQCTMQVSAWKHMTPINYLKMYKLLTEAEKLSSGKPAAARRIRMEMISPLWTALYFWNDCRELFEKNNFTRGSLAAKCRALSAESLSQGKPSNLPVLLKELDHEIKILSTDIPVPEAFKKLPSKDLKIFNYMHAYAHKPKGCVLKKDSESPTGWTISSENKNPKLHGPQSKIKTLSGMIVAVANIGHGEKAIRHSIIPADEKYHWYLIPNVRIGGKTTFWTHFWWIQFNISSAFANADGREDLNNYDVWYSMKLTGPSYVPGSALKNAMAIDQLVLIRTNTETAKKARAKIPALLDKVKNVTLK